MDIHPLFDPSIGLIVAHVGIRILCDVEVVGHSLTGSVRRSGGEAREFTGWLGLLGALQDLLADPGRATGGAPPPDPRPADPDKGYPE